MSEAVRRLSVRCPRCFMPEGVLCRDEKGWHMTNGHRERLDSARVRAAKEKEEALRG
jgi:hypothetical protein